MNYDDASHVQYSAKASRNASAPQAVQPNPATRRTELVHERLARHSDLSHLQFKTLARKSVESRAHPPVPPNKNRTATPGIPVLPIKSPHMLPPPWDHNPSDAFPPISSANAGTKRAAAAAGLDFVKRVTVARSTTTQARSAIRDLPPRPGAFLDQALGGIRRTKDLVAAPANIQMRTAKVARPQKPQKPQIAVKAARKRESVLNPVVSSSSDSSDSSTDSEVTLSQSGSEDEGEGGGGGDVVMKDAAVESPRQTPRLQATRGTDVSFDELVRALEPLALTSVRLRRARRLPFLLRNIRVGFQSRCSALGIDMAPDPRGDPRKVSVTYEIAQTGSHSIVMDGWYCPLCELHGVFRNAEMLGCHLNWDHRKLDGISWEVLDAEEVPRLRITLPTIQRTEARFDIRSLTEPPAAGHPTHAVSSHPGPEPTRPPTTTSATPTRAPNIALSVHPPSPPASSTVLEQTPAPPEYKIELQDLRAEYLSRQPSHTSASPTPLPTRAPRPASLPARYPTPPPAATQLGPAAQPPYLPAEPIMPGGAPVYYSCRPGGPYIYDLLDTLPLAQFGAISWSVLEREEEIYESDDVRDVDKVMHALWARWVTLHRVKFVADAYSGTIAFIDEYWRMIHLAAGWDALRLFLLVFLANRFLTGHDVAEVLRHYDALTGRAFWYTAGE